MSRKNLTKQEISKAIILWDIVYKAISKRYEQFEGRTDLEIEEIVGYAVNEIVIALNEPLLKEINNQLEEIDRINHYQWKKKITNKDSIKHNHICS